MAPHSAKLILPRAPGAWQHVALVLRGSTEEIRLNGSPLGRTDWLEERTSGGVCGLGRYDSAPTGTSATSDSSFFDSFRITPATSGAQAVGSAGTGESVRP